MNEGRLKSLDVLRGFDMFFIMGGWQLVIALCVFLGFGENCFLADQMKHVDWHGFHFCDFIYPLFIFIAGVSFPFSCAKQLECGRTKAQIRLKILRRAVTLFLLGMLVDGFLIDATVHYGSVLGRIGIAWGIAAFLFTVLSWRKRALLCVLSLVGYWMLLRFVGAPDHPEAALYSPLGNISGWLDRLVFPSAHFAEEGPYYNQGPLATLTVVPVTAMLGVFAGEILKTGKPTPERKALVLFAGGTALVALGCLVAYGCGPLSFPLNKKLWTSSYVLVAGGCSAALLALFYHLIDVRGWWRRTLFFTVIGMNSITIYVAQRLVDFRFTARFFLNGLAGALPTSAGEVILDIGYIAVCWLFLYFLHRKGVFLKV